MPVARIIDETGRQGLWLDAIREVLSTAGFGLSEDGDNSAGLTVLVYPDDLEPEENRFPGDLLVLSVPAQEGNPSTEIGRTEVMGSARLKARHHLAELSSQSILIDEIRPLVNLFVH